MVDKLPNIATMEPLEYVEARMAQLPDGAKEILKLKDPSNKAQLAHMFSVEYIRLRHAMLEQNCLQLMRRYMGAMKALQEAVGDKEAIRLFQEAMKEVPENIEEIPQL